ncbi:MAG: hypothetical protein NZ903_02610 [Candidatus Micrarchaeota archaeon]|nr:hypothetical protein [Candidatus Micrarchaeota archaeon]
MNYRDLLLYDFLKNDINFQYCLPIVKKLLQANFRGGKFVITIDKTREKLVITPSEINTRLPEILDFMVKKASIEGYNAIVIPSIISKDQAPNFYIGEETPEPEELWKFIYLLLTGIHGYDYVLNLENTAKDIVENFRSWLMNKKYIITCRENSGLNIAEMISSLQVPKGLPLRELEFVMGFLFISYFAKFLKDIQEEIEIAKDLGRIFSSLSEDATLVIFVLSKQKKKMYIFPKLRNILIRFYGDFFTDEETIPGICRFIFSLYVSYDKYKDISAGILNKLLYYLLQGHINGELLSEAIELKTSYELSKKQGRVYGISASSQFFTKLVFT